MRGVRKSRYREATRALQSGVPDNLRGCWSGLYPESYRSKYQRDWWYGFTCVLASPRIVSQPLLHLTWHHEAWLLVDRLSC